MASRRGPAAAGRRRHRCEGRHPRRRPADRGWLAPAARLARGPGGERCAPAPGMRGTDRRQDCERRVRHGGTGRDPEPAESATHAGRLEQRVGGSGCSRARSAGARHADRCLGNPAGRLLRRRGLPADTRADPGGRRPAVCADPGRRRLPRRRRRLARISRGGPLRRLAGADAEPPADSRYSGGRLPRAGRAKTR